MKQRVRSSCSMQKKEFMRKWMKNLKLCTNLKRSMPILERKSAIKLSADVAIASTRTSSTSWSRAVISNAVENMDRILVQSISGQKVHSNMKLCRKILRKSRWVATRKKVVKRSKSIESRIHVLKGLVPGGNEIVDAASLIREAMDYIASLRVQVEMMNCLASLIE